ncbi:hypothetical protein [Actinokineospora enzanensis]|uniref:hypothetical protein n=1 Tax=Actinokineospora enzanensis TaxID=155975 RepID=UPI00039BFFE8|nr:hypothetical protein [Actinokineospora enzanensis]
MVSTPTHDSTLAMLSGSANTMTAAVRLIGAHQLVAEHVSVGRRSVMVSVHPAALPVWAAALGCAAVQVWATAGGEVAVMVTKTVEGVEFSVFTRVPDVPGGASTSHRTMQLARLAQVLTGHTRVGGAA